VLQVIKTKGKVVYDRYLTETSNDVAHQITQGEALAISVYRKGTVEIFKAKKKTMKKIRSVSGILNE
jgi:hypothetical protein